MTHSVEFEDAWVRIKRAEEGRERLKTEIETWWAVHGHTYRAISEHHGDAKVSIIARVGERPPKEWGLIVGDIVVDLRSALDYAVYALAVRHGPNPLPDPKSVEFPIARAPKNFAHRAIKHLPKGARDFIERIQPYQPGYGGPGVTSSPLYILNELVGVNKHRFIQVFCSALDVTRLDIDMLNVEIEDFVAYRIEGELKDRTVLATLRVVPKADHAQIKIKSMLAPYIAFEQPSAAQLAEAYTLLGELGGPVESVVKDLETWL